MCSRCALLLVRMLGTLVWEECLYTKLSSVINLYSTEEHLELSVGNCADVHIIPLPRCLV